MAQAKVTINGVEYPCRPTMGAMLRFKKETGKEVTEINSNSLSDLCVYLYCCVASACAADKKEFSMSMMEFADALDPDTMQEMTKQMQAASPVEEDSEKKS